VIPPNHLFLKPEHRYYGASLPTGAYDTRKLEYLTAEEALADAATLIQAKRVEFKCSGIGSEPRCPVIVCGGSYPAFLAAMMRLRFPEVVDMAYAASAPMKFYSQAVDQYEYYAVVTESAKRVSPTCPDAVRSMLAKTLATAKTVDEVVAGARLCDPLPPYLASGDLGLLVNEVSMVVAYTFANLNMANYPPSTPDSPTGLFTTCMKIENSVSSGDSWGALASFLSGFCLTTQQPTSPLTASSSSSSSSSCFNLSSQLPSGVNATISSGDWSGVGTGDDGSSWDFETCTYLVEAIGMNNVTDMFLPRSWSLQWLMSHCQARFGVTPSPRTLPDLWGFDEDRLAVLTSRIIFTNGLNDGWSAGGLQRNLSESLIVYNMQNGAHHSDLNHLWPSPADSEDVTEVRELVAQQLIAWLKEL